MAYRGETKKIKNNIKNNNELFHYCKTLNKFYKMRKLRKGDSKMKHPAIRGRSQILIVSKAKREEGEKHPNIFGADLNPFLPLLKILTQIRGSTPTTGLNKMG